MARCDGKTCRGYWDRKSGGNAISGVCSMDGWEEGSKKLISNSAMKAMEDFVTNWKGGD